MTAARAMYTAVDPAQVVSDSRVPFIWFKETGNEVAAPPERQGEMLPDNFAEYRQRFSAESSLDFQQMTEEVILFVNYGGIGHQKVLDSLELFAKEVMPAFAD